MRKILDDGDRVIAFADELSAVLPDGSVTHLLFTARQPDVCSRRLEPMLRVQLTVPTDQVMAIAKVLQGGRLDMPASADEEHGKSTPLH